MADWSQNAYVALKVIFSDSSEGSPSGLVRK